VSNIDENGNLMYEDDPEEDQRLLDKKARKNRNKKNKKKLKQAAKLLESEQVVVENGQPTEPVPQPQPQEAALLPPQTLQVPKPDERSGVKTSPTKKSKKERKRDKDGPMQEKHFCFFGKRENLVLPTKSFGP
jgi:hypothetical protein